METSDALTARVSKGGSSRESLRNDSNDAPTGNFQAGRTDITPIQAELVEEAPEDQASHNDDATDSSRSDISGRGDILITWLELFPGIILACPTFPERAADKVNLIGAPQPHTLQEWIDGFSTRGKRFLIVETGSEDSNTSLETIAMDVLRSQFISITSSNVYCMANICDLLSIWSLWMAMDRSMNVFVFDALCMNPLCFAACALSSEEALPDAVCARISETVQG